MSALGLPAAAWGGGSPPSGGASREIVAVYAGGGDSIAMNSSDPAGKKDAEDFESFLLVNMERRCGCTARLKPAFFDRLRQVIRKAAAEVPGSFHYFVGFAPRFDEDRITRIFEALRDDPEGFPDFVRATAQLAHRLETGAAADGGQGEVPSGFAVQGYESYLSHHINLPVINWGNELTPEEYGRYFDGDSLGRSREPQSSPVAAGCPFQAVGAAEPAAGDSSPVSAAGAFRPVGPAEPAAAKTAP